MKKIKGMTFAPFAKRGELEGNEVQKSLQTMIQNTGSNTVILLPEFKKHLIPQRSIGTPN